jgi:hypothetical protein
LRFNQALAAPQDSAEDKVLLIFQSHGRASRTVKRKGRGKKGPVREVIAEILLNCNWVLFEVF